MSEEIKETPDGELAQGEFKVKKKMKKLATDKDVAKINIANEKKPEAKAVIKQPEIEKNQEAEVEKVKEEQPVVKETKNEDSPVMEEIKLEEVLEDEKNNKEIVKNIEEQPKQTPQVNLPENVEKLVSFMKDTGGTVEDYVLLNKDYDRISGEDLLKQYYSVSKPHLNVEEVNFLMDDNFAWNDDDEERSVKKKKLAYKEEIAKAKQYLKSSKEKYFEDIKLKPSISKEQLKATDFFNRYNDEQEVIKKRHEVFTNNTKKLFSEEFKGFEYKVGDKAFRYNVNNKNDVANNQSDLNNFVGKFLDKKGEIKDYKNYHKALYTASNADKLAQHFYEQGKTDAIRDVNAKSKNITNQVRATSSGDMFINGMKIKAISGVDSSKLKIKKNN